MRSADANRSRVDPASLKDMLDQAELINENASGATTETGAGGGQGQCQGRLPNLRHRSSMMRPVTLVRRSLRLIR